MKERKLWFIPRPERDPLYHVDGLRALSKATHDFSKKWEHERDTQRQFERELITAGVKKDHVSSAGSGGRTWAALFRSFGYVYINPLGDLKPTKVGLAIINGKKVRENVTKQILCFQIPNSYFMSSHFRPHFEEGFAIRPIRFLLKMVNQKQLGYKLTKTEILFFVLKAKKDIDIVKITSDIIRFRQASEEERTATMETIANTYDHRERVDNQARSFAEAHMDEAHTFMLIAQYVGLVNYVYGKNGNVSRLEVPECNREKLATLLTEFDIRYPFNRRYMISPESFSLSYGLDVDSYKAPPISASSVATQSEKLINKANRLLGSHPEIDPEDEHALREFLASLGEFSPEHIQILVDTLSQHKYEQLSDSFVESYIFESDPIEFENKTYKLLQALGLNVMLRPEPVRNRGPRIELATASGDVRLGLIDCKNYSKTFSLSSNLADYMGTEYIPDYEGLNGMKVEYFGYITSGKFAGEANLEKATMAAKSFIPSRTIKGFIINASTLLALVDYCISNRIPMDVRSELLFRLSLNKGYRSMSDLPISLFGE